MVVFIELLLMISGLVFNLWFVTLFCELGVCDLYSLLTVNALIYNTTFFLKFKMAPYIQKKQSLTLNLTASSKKLLSFVVKQ